MYFINKRILGGTVQRVCATITYYKERSNKVYGIHIVLKTYWFLQIVKYHPVVFAYVEGKVPGRSVEHPGRESN